MGVKAFIIALFLCVSPSVFAQKTAVLVTVRLTEDPEDIRFWWRDDQPAPTTEIAALNEALSVRGIKVVIPPNLSGISRIVRQPSLTDLSAMNLAKVMGADQALVGDLVISNAGRLGPLQLSETRFELNARILKWPQGLVDSRPLPLQSVSVFSSTENRRIGGTYLGDVVSTWLVQPTESPDAVGFPGQEPRIVVPRTLGMAAVDAIRSRLASGAAKKVVIAWVSDAAVGLELNPAATDTRDTIRTWIDVALSAPFEGFSANVIPTPEADGSLRLQVQRTITP
jgi:hypothetical protein